MKQRSIDIDAKYHFAQSIRGQFIIGQALHIASNYLKTLEDRENMFPPDGEHAEPSNREDMEYLLGLYPLYLTYQDSQSKFQKAQKDAEQLELMKGNA